MGGDQICKVVRVVLGLGGKEKVQKGRKGGSSGSPFHTLVQERHVERSIETGSGRKKKRSATRYLHGAIEGKQRK